MIDAMCRLPDASPAQGSIFFARGETFAQKTIFSIGEPLPS
jgi:hypothetical protein